VGAILQTSAFWITSEKRIRQVSFLGAPFWLVYNFVSQAYGSAVGSLLSIVSIGLAICRYDIYPKAHE
jgi:thiol:disulfide interchange protein